MKQAAGKPVRTGKRFFGPTAILLTAVAIAKIYSAFGSAKVLLEVDGIFHIQNRLVLIGAAGIEFVVAAHLVLGRETSYRAISLLWLSSNLMLYRLINALLGLHYCPCLGTIGNNLPLTKDQQGMILAVLVTGWILGSIAILVKPDVSGGSVGDGDRGVLLSECTSQTTLKEVMPP